ncbi:hypothetical protein B296_00012399 [Ensete ventricosum]|uniref:Uncharacterized protein n=1 Tax=Ensete ventricosum TaxID=4639 RepID=A0A427AD97_ENSVE|nr:hypothetical protein B296_00012399 [Ensete ventricosum]
MQHVPRLLLEILSTFGIMAIRARRALNATASFPGNHDGMRLVVVLLWGDRGSHRAPYKYVLGGGGGEFVLWGYVPGGREGLSCLREGRGTKEGPREGKPRTRSSWSKEPAKVAEAEPATGRTPLSSGKDLCQTQPRREVKSFQALHIIDLQEDESSAPLQARWLSLTNESRFWLDGVATAEFSQGQEVDELHHHLGDSQCQLKEIRGKIWIMEDDLLKISRELEAPRAKAWEAKEALHDDDVPMEVEVPFDYSPGASGSLKLCYGPFVCQGLKVCLSSLLFEEVEVCLYPFFRCSLREVFNLKHRKDHLGRCITPNARLKGDDGLQDVEYAGYRCPASQSCE